MNYLIIALVMALGGCVSTQIVTSTPDQVFIKHAFNPDFFEKAIPMAEAECQKQGKHAVYQGISQATIGVFNCVD